MGMFDCLRCTYMRYGARRHNNCNSADKGDLQRGLQVSGSWHESHGLAARHQRSSGESAELPQAPCQDDQHNRGDCSGGQHAFTSAENQACQHSATSRAHQRHISACDDAHGFCGQM